MNFIIIIYFEQWIQPNIVFYHSYETKMKKKCSVIWVVLSGEKQRKMRKKVASFSVFSHFVVWVYVWVFVALVSALFRLWQTLQWISVVYRAKDSIPVLFVSFLGFITLDNCWSLIFHICFDLFAIRMYESVEEKNVIVVYLVWI